ncbi:MAG: CPBP family intramembrane glutamic endopeptidase [Armatimonadota bacterium]
MESRLPPATKAWRWYLMVLGVVVGAIAALNAVPAVYEPAPRAVEHLPARSSDMAATVLVFVIVLAGVVGLGLAAGFVRNRRRLLSGGRPRIQPQVPLLALLVFLVAKAVLELCFATAILVSTLDSESNLGATVHLTGQIATLVAAFALAMRVLRWLTSVTNEDAREIGFHPIALTKAVGWGIGGYCAAIPIAYGSAAAVYWLYRTFSGQAAVPQHPIVPEMLKGTPAFVVAVTLAVVAAPVVEETVFRGMLYSALRAVIGTWGASVLSAAVFALVHPTSPIMFVPLLALGIVFAILRESTGSLAPSMVCHAANNAVMIALARLTCG